VPALRLAIVVVHRRLDDEHVPVVAVDGDDERQRHGAHDAGDVLDCNTCCLHRTWQLPKRSDTSDSKTQFSVVAVVVNCSIVVAVVVAVDNIVVVAAGREEERRRRWVEPLLLVAVALPQLLPLLVELVARRRSVPPVARRPLDEAVVLPVSVVVVGLGLAGWHIQDACSRHLHQRNLPGCWEEVEA